MKTTLEWFPVTTIPEGDVYNALVAVEEENQNYEVYKKMGMAAMPTHKHVTSAIYVWNDSKWMAFGEDITPKVKHWSVPEYPNEE